MVNEAEVKVKSLQKALEILNCFTKKSSWGVTEISEQLDLNKSNVHNILTTFKAMGYLDQDDESGRYKLGLSVYSLCYSLGQNLSIGSVAAPYLQELADMAGERVYLAIPHEQELIRRPPLTLCGRSWVSMHRCIVPDWARQCWHIFQRRNNGLTQPESWKPIPIIRSRTGMHC